ncbi:DUF6483 family protein [Paenibacillus eucommiae]|uniref:Uncharacterized protein YeaO (DUF488 family) n=1 Tax=Paenibacillus eucommiae TaxID=1355755 RepID=A0ABS4J0E5_9BACL|nr:DUF6483 family protein [Paenibacillus eucommiae]MBP1993291.1 uncharacterized protein YeaO (DUF488 family) [Paenibacillus eucommiae]
MFQRDYFMRQIGQLTLALHRVLFHKEHKQFEEAQRLVDEAARHILGLNMKSLRALSIKDILNLLTYNEVTDTAKAVVLADLLKEEGELYAAAGETEEAYDSRVKALELMLTLNIDYREDNPVLKEELQPRLEELLGSLGKQDLPTRVKQQLLVFYEEKGAFAKVEDVFFHLLEDEPERAATRKQAVSFYERLLEKDELSLKRGNFSRAEANEGLKLLRQD